MNLSDLPVVASPIGDYVLSMSSEVAAGETKEIFVEPTCTFRPNRLIIPETSLTRLKAFSHFMSSLPIALLENFLALFGSQCGPGWMPPPYYPVAVLQLKIGVSNQFRDAQPIYAGVFGVRELDPNLHFDVCDVGQRITIVVRNTAKHAVVFRVGLLGTVLGCCAC
jgi:hypothetical protein